LSASIYLFIFIRKSKTDQYRNGNEVLIAKGETIACPFSMFIRYVELSGMNLDSDFYIFRPIFRSKGTCKLIYKNKKLSYAAARESIVSKQCACSRRVHIEGHMNRVGINCSEFGNFVITFIEFMSSWTIIPITIVFGLFCQKKNTNRIFCSIIV
jgi:hypothetical protein